MTCHTRKSDNTLEVFKFAFFKKQVIEFAKNFLNNKSVPHLL